MADAPDEESDRQPPLARWARWLLGIAGVSLIGAGSVAVFIKDTNVAGVPLLILAGSAFLYVAFTGQRLLQVSKDGVTFSKERRAQETLAEVAGDQAIPPETRAHIVDLAEENGIRLPTTSSAEIELAVRELLARIGAGLGFAVQDDGSGQADFVLLVRGEIRVPVEVKFHSRLREFNSALRHLQSLDAPFSILIIEGGLPQAFLSAYLQRRILVLGWGADAQDDWSFQLREFLNLN